MAHIENLESIIQEYKSTRKAIFSDEKDTKKCASQTQEEENKQPDEVHKKSSKEKNIPIAEKILLTLEEAALLTGIGQNKLREISNKEDCPFVLWNGSKRMFKMEKLIAFLNSAFSL